MKKMLKKCSTDQSLNQKRNTTYKIGTVVFKSAMVCNEATSKYCKRRNHGSKNNFANRDKKHANFNFATHLKNSLLL